MQHYLMTKKQSHQKSHSTQERIRVQHHLQDNFSFTGPFSQYTEPPMRAKSVQSCNMHAQRTLAGFNLLCAAHGYGADAGGFQSAVT